MQGAAGDSAEGAEGQGVVVRHRVGSFSDRWTIPEEPVPEAAWHDRAAELVRALLAPWLVRTGADGAVFRNLAVRVRKENPRVGMDPDVLLVMPAPPGAPELSSLRLWEPDHPVPSLVVEVVSPTHPQKDYVAVPSQCAALGVRELVIFDPKRHGPSALGGPSLLQLWRRTGPGVFERVGAGDGPLESEVLDAYLVPSEATGLLRIADDPAGDRLWLTAEEAERAEKEAERAEKEAALARIRELEAELSRQRTAR